MPVAVRKVADLSASDDGVAFLVTAAVVFDIIAAFCSSPQTAEINVDKRAETLMKWVWLGLGTAALFVGASMFMTNNHKKPIILGGAMAGTVLGVAYVYAKHSGLKSGQPGTET